MENVRRRKDIRICNDSSKLQTYVNKPTYCDSRLFCKGNVLNSVDVVGVHLLKQEVVLDKPIYIGQAVLDISKLIMYQLRLL